MLYIIPAVVVGFTGIDSAYESPDSPDLELRTDMNSVSSCVQQCIGMLEQAGIVPRSAVEAVEELFVPDNLLDQYRQEAESLPYIDMNKLDLQWLQVLSEGWATPLRGFMREREYLQSQHFNCLFDGKQQ